MTSTNRAVHISGVTINTSAGLQPPAFIATSNVTFSGVSFIGPMTTQSVAAATSQSIYAKWSAGRQTNSSNISLPLGTNTFFINPNLQ